jgi:SAM-dependent methyltransferase
MLRPKQVVKSIIPERHRDRVRVAGYRALHYGRRRFCPCCYSHVRHFLPYGEVPRPDARCPVCGALERHRAASLFFEQRAGLFNQVRRILHVAPEPHVSRVLQRVGVDYLSIDLESDNAMLRMDVTDLELPDESFDAIYCSHVLEHVPEDRRALAEFRRILRIGGWVVVQVPIKGATTFEDPSITDPRERRRLFGQGDHVRLYGRDIDRRLKAAGFAVTVDWPAARLGANDIGHLGLDPGDAIHLCRKVA